MAEYEYVDLVNNHQKIKMLKLLFLFLFPSSRAALLNSKFWSDLENI